MYYNELLKMISNKIYEWYYSRQKYVNIISPPYNSCDIFLKTIIDAAKQNKRILYLTWENENPKILISIKKNTIIKDYFFLKQRSMSINAVLTVCNMDNINIITKQFDLVIYDGISHMPLHDSYKIKNICDKFCTENGKILFYYFKDIASECEEIIFPANDSMKPLFEPRIITTRIDINKNIPYVVYEYLEWSIMSNKKVIIYVPSSKKVKNVYDYILKFKKCTNKNIIYYINNITNYKELIKFSKKKKAILITDYYGEEYLNFCNSNVMIYFADDKVYNCNNLMYLCTRASISQNQMKGEVIFLTKEITDQILEVKDIIRKLNIEIWDMNLLKR